MQDADWKDFAENAENMTTYVIKLLIAQVNLND